MSKIKIPQNLLPQDGRFGSGPSLVPDLAVQELAARAREFMGNSHRQANVKGLMARFQQGCKQLFQLPEEWEILMGNGGASVFWDALSFCGIEAKSQHLSFGEFSSKFARIVAAVPHLLEPEIIESELGSCAEPVFNKEIDFYALTHNETSTGVVAELLMPAAETAGAAKASQAGRNFLTAVDATSAAGAISWDPSQLDIYYFSLQKAFSADGGIWVACCSPPAVERFQKLANERWCPSSLDLNLAYQNSIKNQTLNTPAIATIFLAVHYLDWVLENGGLIWAENRCRASSQKIYDWAESCSWAEPFVKESKNRSPLIATIEMDENISSSEVSAVLRENGIVDTDSYRKLNRNQLRFGLFPVREPEDASALIACLEYVVENL